jgi:hypothetical protein
MLIVFDGRQENLSNSINVVAVTGWSRDGKVAIVQPGSTMYLQPLKIEYDEIKPGTQPKIYAVRGNKRKKISSVDIPGNFAEIKGTFAVKSPFENRLLIITHVSSEHIEFDYTFYTFTYTGCHLTAGF